MKSISKVPNKKYNKPEGVNRDIEESAKAETEFGETDKMRKVKGMKKLKSVKKIKNIINIDDDLALKMKKEVEEGNRAKPAGESGEKVVSGGEAERHQGEVGGEDVQAKIDRILKMFNASSLDDIIEVTPIKSIQEVNPDEISIRDIPDDRGSSYRNFSRVFFIDKNLQAGLPMKAKRKVKTWKQMFLLRDTLMRNILALALVTMLSLLAWALPLRRRTQR